MQNFGMSVFLSGLGRVNPKSVHASDDDAQDGTPTPLGPQRKNS